MKRLVLALSLLVAASLSGNAQGVRFAFLTDCHYSEGAVRVGALKECIADINSSDPVDFVLFGGDITDFGSDEELAAVKTIFDELKYPYYVVAGNHDAKWSESGCNTFLKVFGYEHFEFEKGGWRFLGCNCGPDMRMAPALLPKESMLWLHGLEPGKKSVFVNHYPQDSSVLNYFDVTRELKRAGVQWEIGGHWHTNNSLNYDGIPAVLCRSTYDNGTGYSLVTMTDDHVTVNERKNVDGKWTTLPAWYEQDLGPVEDKTIYDKDGFADSYPWMRYDVNEKYPQVEKLWTISDDSNIVCGFAKRGHKAFYATSPGVVKSIDIRNGKVLWTKKLPGKVFSTPVVEGRRLVVGCTDGYIYALKPGSGKEVWKVKAQKSVLGTARIKDGIAYIGASDGHFRAIRISDGGVVWDRDGVQGFVESTPYVDDAQVVFGTWAGKLYSLNPADGSVQWVWNSPVHSRMHSPAATVPVKSAGRIFIALPDRKVYAIDALSGETVFWVNGGREAIGLSGDGNTVFAKTMHNHTYAFDAAAGLDKVGADGQLDPAALKWNAENQMGYEISPSPLVEADGVLLVPSDKGNIIAHDARTGELLWAHKISIALINPMTVFSCKGKTYVLASTMDGKVELLRY